MPGPALRDAHNVPSWFSMIERQIDSPMPIPLGLVVKKALKSCVALLRVDANARVLDRDKHLATVVQLRPDQQLAPLAGDRRHCLHAVDEQLDDHLLQLDAITEHGGQPRRQFQAQGHPMAEHLAPHQRDHLADDVVDVRRRLLGQGARRRWMIPLARLPLLIMSPRASRTSARSGTSRSSPAGKPRRWCCARR